MKLPEPTITRTDATRATIRRGFAGASCADVFAGLTQPDLLRQWQQAAGRRLTECQADVRTGGSYRHGFTAPGRRPLVMFGAYREVVDGKRIVHTEQYEGYDWPALVVTTELAPAANGTVMTVIVEYPSQEICDRDFPNLEHSLPGYEALAAVLAAGGR